MTAGSGDGYAADLWSLYKIGRTDIMELADDYDALASGVDATSAHSIDPAPVSSNYRGASALRCGGLLSTLRWELQLIFAQSCVNVSAAATGLMETAEAYAATDEEIGGDFDTRVAGRFGDSDPAEPPDPPFPSGRYSPGGPIDG